MRLRAAARLERRPGHFTGARGGDIGPGPGHIDRGAPG